MRALRWSLVLVWMGLLAYMSLGREYPPPIEGALRVTGTTILHFGGYAVLAALLGWAVGGRGRATSAAPALAFAFVYGAVLEMLQLLVPGRTATWSDLGVNLAGALVGAAVLRAVALLQKGRRRPQHGPSTRVGSRESGEQS